MEKLQAALQKAREDRQNRSGAVLPDPQSPAATTAVLPSISARWEAVQPFEISEEVLKRHRVVTRTAGPMAAPFDILRTKVLLQMQQNDWKRLAITSPMPGAGKTTIACNMILGLGRQRNIRSMLLDLDLRNPSVSDFFDYEPSHGMGDVLTGNADFAEQAVRHGDNVIISMARHADRDPTRMLLAEQTTEVLDEIEARYQPSVMIFDLPSMLVNDDTRAFLKNVDCALIVIRANSTHYDHFDTCEREVAEQTNVLGVVLNADRTKSAENYT